MVFQPDKKNKYSMRVAVQKIFCVVIAAALAISLTACQKNSDGAESAVSAASASTTGTTYTGTVTEISEESITISTEDGATVTAAMTSDTVIARGMGPGGTQPPEGTPPQQPGQAGEGESVAQSGETPPEMLEGQAPDGMGEGMPQEELTADSITVGASVTIEVDENNTAISVTLSGGMGAGPGGAGVFAYGSGTAYVSDTTITAMQNTAGGIHVAGGGTLYAWDLNVETNGESSAAIRSDRGSGTMVVDAVLILQTGLVRPPCYSTADITVHDADLTANGADSHFTAIEQTMEGDVIWDSISKLDFYLTQGSTWTGAMIQDESNTGAGGDVSGASALDAWESFEVENLNA